MTLQIVSFSDGWLSAMWRRVSSGGSRAASPCAGAPTAGEICGLAAAGWRDAQPMTVRPWLRHDDFYVLAPEISEAPEFRHLCI